MKSNSLNRIWLLILGIFSSLLISAAPSVKISMDAPNSKVGVEETFHIIIDATNCAGHIDISSLPPGVKIVYRTTRQTSSVSQSGGKVEQNTTTSLILTCKGETPGKYTFGPVAVDGRSSNTISYQIVENQGGSKNSSANQNSNYGALNGLNQNSGPLFIGKGNEEMFLKAIVNKSSAYEQEAIEYSVKLYTTYDDIKFLGAAAAPKFEGFVVEESQDVSKSFTFEDYNGKTFKTAVIAKYIIFPQKAGNLKITGNTYTVSTDAKQYYHDPYYQTITVKQPIQLNIKPNDIEVEVKSLPTPVPQDFIGGVGTFTISTNMPSKKLATNTAASYIIKIEGTGNVKYIKLPELSSYLPASLEVYSPEITSDVKVGSSNVSGITKFEYSIIPKEAGKLTIPAIVFSYFDPETGKYCSLHTEKYELMIETGTSSAKSQSAVMFDNNLLPIGKTFINIRKPYVETFTYWLWYIIPIIVFIIILIYYRHYIKQRDNIILYKSKNANKMALKRLNAAYQYYKQQKEGEFYDAMLTALWGYLAEKLQIPTSQLNRNNVGEEFKEHGVKESTFLPILHLIDECEYAKYTPVSRESNMRQLYTDAVESITNVESEYEEEKHKLTDNLDDGDDNIDNKNNYVNSQSTDSPASSHLDEAQNGANKI